MGAACFLKLTSVLDRDKRLSTLAASNCCRIVERGSFHSSSSDQTSRKTPIIDFLKKTHELENRREKKGCWAVQPTALCGAAGGLGGYFTWCVTCF